MRAAQPGAQRVVIGAWGPSTEVCELALERMRFALGVDDDLSEFHARFRGDSLIGGLVRRFPWLRPTAPPGAVRGAGLGDLRAADRVPAGGRDRAADRSPARAHPGGNSRHGAAAAARCAERGGARRHRAGAAGVLRSVCGAGAARCGARRARWPAAASICAAPTTSARGGGCGHCRASAAGPSSVSRCTARGASTRSRPEIWALRKLVGRLRSGDPRERAPEAGGARVLRALRAVGRARGGLRDAARRFVALRAERSGSLSRQELVGDRQAGVAGPGEQAVAMHPRAEGLPGVGVLVAKRLAGVAG